MFFIFIQATKDSPDGEKNSQREHHVRDQNTGKKKKAHTSGYAKPRVETRASPESPSPKPGDDDSKSNRRQRHRNTSSPITHPEYLV
jgi:hypothetical protein